MTKQEAAEKLGLKVFDCAVPEAWLDMLIIVYKKLVRNSLADESVFLISHFVWCYDEINGKPSTFGYPRPLTTVGIQLLKQFNLANGTSYYTDFEVI